MNVVPLPSQIFIMSDDLGWGEVSWTPGRTNTNLSTPHIDALARSGMRFVDAYTGSPVCAPSRGTLMTGQHTGHATIRGNKDSAGGNLPLAKGDKTFFQALKGAGYHGEWRRRRCSPSSCLHPRAAHERRCFVSSQLRAWASGASVRRNPRATPS